MPYTSYPRKDADQLVVAVKAAAEAVKKNMNPLKSSELKKKLAEAGQKLKTKLDSDVAGVRVNTDAHFLKIEGFLTQASQYFKEAKDAYARWQKTGENKDKDLATYGVGMIQQMHTFAKQDAKEYGESWFQLRAFNSGVDPAFSSAFNAEVGKIMAQGKNYTGKIEKISLMAKEADALKKLVNTEHNAPAYDIEDYQKAAEELFVEMDKMAKEMVVARNAFSVAEQNASSISKYAKDKKLALKSNLKNIEDVQVNFLSVTKRYVSTLASMKRVYDTRVKAIPAEAAKDGEVKASVAKAKSIIETTEKDVKRIEGLLQQAIKDVVIIRGYFKK